MFYLSVADQNKLKRAPELFIGLWVCIKRLSNDILCGGQNNLLLVPHKTMLVYIQVTFSLHNSIQQLQYPFTLDQSFGYMSKKQSHSLMNKLVIETWASINASWCWYNWLVCCKYFLLFRVFLVASVPGEHVNPSSHASSHLQSVTDVLSKHCSIPERFTLKDSSWGILAQSSSLGFYGDTPSSWLKLTLLQCLACHKKSRPSSNHRVPISIIYPSIRNVLSGRYGTEGASCLNNQQLFYEKQLWLVDYL